MKYIYSDSAYIATDFKTLTLGDKYDYKEESFIGECQFIEDLSDNQYNRWKFKWTIAPMEAQDNKEFTCTELKHSNAYYFGMWQILPQGTYSFKRRARKSS
jgi:hypothetical protein